MKLKIKKEEILKGLQRIQGVVEKKNTMPILSNMLLIADDRGVEIIATDLEIGLRGRYAAEVDKPGAVTVSAKKMYEIVRELPADDIQINVEENNWVRLQTGRSQFKLVGLPRDEYPALPDVAEEGMIVIEGDMLRDMIKKTLYAVGENDARYVLNGLFVHMTQTKSGLNIRMVGTDGHRLSMIDRVVDAKHKEESIIIPAVKEAQAAGLAVEGPFPADTLFWRHLQGEFAAIICMYHDQGLIPLKLLHFMDGVNVTLGLPIIRTSVDHGTAYNLAGTGKASPDSLKAAIVMAAEMANRRFGEKG